MDLTNHVMTDLFDQLGLPSSEAEMTQFIADHRPLPESVKLADAPFWSKGQAQFLREEINEDSEWAPLVDQLNTSLRA
ncbi:hypothetical protein RD110_24315 [Rhodoferax koreense]|uniref:DUF2789 domain-containing protein n=1 Tax=Rhodoferax koreensis TaxID=1842727 RepID=A0A1P8K1P8_9BURK|nr:DUF2789 domain-containing protein [Rhodoferax koreense]APW39942.1 hypothetical protein RD110_24315 [Rhodoferax koreense]